MKFYRRNTWVFCIQENLFKGTVKSSDLCGVNRVRHIKKIYTDSPVMSLVRVWTDIGTGKNVSLVARIIETNGPIFTIQFLSPTENKDKHGCTIYRYEDDTYEIDDDSITHYLETDDESDVGFKCIGEGEWIRTGEESDEDYIPSEEEDSGSDEEDEEDFDEEEPDEEFDEGDDYGDDYGDDE